MGGSFRSDDGGVVLFVQGVEEWFFLRRGLGEVGGRVERGLLWKMN